MTGTKREYAARRRKNGDQGCTERAVNLNRVAGHLSADLFDGSRVLDFDECDRQWEANVIKRESDQDRTKAPASASGGVDARAPGEPSNGQDPNSKPMTPHQRREHWQAMREELQTRKDDGELIPRADARQLFLDSITMARAALEVMPIRLPDRLVGLTAPAMRIILAAEIETILRGLANAAGADTASAIDPEL